MNNEAAKTGAVRRSINSASIKRWGGEKSNVATIKRAKSEVASKEPPKGAQMKRVKSG